MELYVMSIMEDYLKREGIPVVRTPHGLLIKDVKVIFSVLHAGWRYSHGRIDALYPVIFHEYKLFMVVHESVVLPGKLVKLADKLLTFKSNDCMINCIKELCHEMRLEYDAAQI